MSDVRRKYGLMLVDDDPLITSGTGADLAQKGYAVTTANSGDEAIQLLKRSSFDLVIVDLVMTPVNGLEVLKASKEICPETMVIVLTGYGSMDSAIDALRLEADDYLLKPCDPEEMHFRISRCLEKLELRRTVKIYETMLPVCCVCKRVRDDAGTKKGEGEWVPMEKFIHDKAGMVIASTYCPVCARELDGLGVDRGLDIDEY